MKIHRMYLFFFLLFSLFLVMGKTACFGHENGQRLLFFFQGNTNISEKNLRNAAQYELQGLESEPYRLSRVDDAAFMMKVACWNKGYPEATVDYRAIDHNGNEKHITFIINEGKKVLVDQFLFEGLDQLEPAGILIHDTMIRENVLKKIPFLYVKRQINSLSQDIKSVYIAEGFINAVIHPPQIVFNAEKNRATVTISIEEGVRYTVGRISFSGDITEESSAEINKTADKMKGTRYFPRQKFLLQSKIMGIYGNLGFLRPEVVIKTNRNDVDGIVDLHAEITSGLRVVIGNIFVEGNQRTRRSIILKRMRLHPGKPYSLKARQESFSNLFQTGLFSRIDITFLDTETAEKKDVMVKLEEKPSRQVYIEPGWGSYELLRLKTGYKNSSLFGSGRIFRTDAGISAKGRSIEFDLIDPWLFGTSLSGNIPLYYRYREEPSFTLEESGIGCYLSKKFHKKIVASIGYEYSSNHLSDIDLDADLYQADDNYSTASVIMQVVKDTRNDLFFPTSGNRRYMSLKLAIPSIGGELSYCRLTGGTRYFHQIADSLVLGLRYSTGVIFPTGSQKGIPLGERFYNGGENSVRSFKKSRLGPVDADGEPIGGAAFNLFNLELRKKMTPRWASSLFVDVGNVAPNSNNLRDEELMSADSSDLIEATLKDYFRDMRAGVGLGIQYLLPVGPARLDFGWNPYHRKHEDSFVVHFSIGMAF
ncbi:MAG: outer membrane protein assembly factor BamA [Desulfobulbaceae bacterium]|nr:outer membrane protein assembly factor BamA [Desulfobulbaceae bacterium]